LLREGRQARVGRQRDLRPPVAASRLVHPFDSRLLRACVGGGGHREIAMPRSLSALALALVGLAGPGCVWIHPTEPMRPLPIALAKRRFGEVAVDFAPRWHTKTPHPLPGAAVLDLDRDGRQEIFVGGGAGQPDALLALAGDRLVDRIEGSGLSSLEATYGSCA